MRIVAKFYQITQQKLKGEVIAQGLPCLGGTHHACIYLLWELGGRVVVKGRQGTKPEQRIYGECPKEKIIKNI